MWLTYNTVMGYEYLTSSIFIWESLAFLIIVLSVFAYVDMYNYSVYLNRFRYFYRTTKGIFYSFIVYLIWMLLFKPHHIHPKLFPIVLIISFALFTYFNRIVFFPLLTLLFPDKELILYAPEGESNLIERWIKNHSLSKIEIKEKITEKNKIDDYIGADIPILLSTTTESWNELFNYILKFKNKNYLLLFSTLLSNINGVDYWPYINEIPLVPFRWSGNTGVYKVLKRIFDITGSTIAITIFSPVMIISSILIKLTSRGKVLFKQKRLTRDKEEFEMLKFRSMRESNNHETHKEFVKDFINGNNGNKEYKIKEDSRVTRVGNILRKTSIDEFPQFFNVLKGDLSLVGPRPPIGYEIEHYRDWHSERLSVKQGITGVWQNFGRSQLPFDKACFLDIYYAKNRSLWMDLHLVTLTFPTIVFGKGAY